MGGGVDQRAVIVLAVDLDQHRTELPHHLHADRLVVDEGARAAVGKLHPAQDQFVLGGDVVGGEDLARRMLGGDLEHGGDLPLLQPLAHQASDRRGRRAPARSASSRIDLPAPVSPVSTARCSAKSMSSRSIRTMSRMERRASMATLYQDIRHARHSCEVVRGDNIRCALAVVPAEGVGPITPEFVRT